MESAAVDEGHAGPAYTHQQPHAEPASSPSVMSQDYTTTDDLGQSGKDIKTGTRSIGGASSIVQAQVLPIRVKGDMQKEDATEEKTKKALHILALPDDILRDIIKQVTHTNDLCALALTHRDLHALVTPQIYSRFDIVWPEGGENAGPRAGVDALTYGLATLVMAEDVYGEAGWQRERERQIQQQAPGQMTIPKRRRAPTETQIRKRRGNYYAQYIRKFSLGNGPKDLVDEYLTNKEQGKMLGTLVALALARMKRLETFIWDMPTGILGDVWTSLSYIGDREDCRLDRVWVRWHDNSALAREQSGNPESPETVGHSIATRYALERVEHPSFSELPPLKSLNVLDIDELQYLDEMSVLIENSLDKLRELRVGIAKQVKDMDWTKPWDGEGAEQIDHANPTKSTLTIPEKRLGGVMGVLTGRFYDLKQRIPPRHLMRRLRRRSSSAQLAPPAPSVAPTGEESPADSGAVHAAADSNESATTAGPSNEDDEAHAPREDSTPAQLDRQASLESLIPSSPEMKHSGPPAKPQLELVDEEEEKQSGDIPKLRIEVLELERVVLHLPVLENALDWTKLTSLTLYDCANHEQLWKALRREYTPRESATLRIKLSKSSDGSPKATVKRALQPASDRPPIQLKRICTNTVSSALISFIKDTIPANTLEAIFLSDPSSTATTVNIDFIYRGIMKRHRTSLQKVYIDSTRRSFSGRAESFSTAWKRWSLPRPVVKFALSHMPNLRELGACIEYRKDWFYLLEHLPKAPQLRSLFIRSLGTGSTGLNMGPTPKDLALQILHTVVLRPNMELCYIGIVDKCFEIQEGTREGTDRSDHSVTLADDLSDADADEDDDDDNDVDADDDTAASDVVSDDEMTGDESSATDADADEERKLRLREILFYDDKVEIFKVRHGRI